MPIRELRDKYGRNLKGREAVNRAIRHELPGGEDAVQALHALRQLRRKLDDAAEIAAVREAEERVHRIVDRMAETIADRYDLASARGFNPRPVGRPASDRAAGRIASRRRNRRRPRPATAGRTKTHGETETMMQTFRDVWTRVRRSPGRDEAIRLAGERDGMDRERDRASGSYGVVVCSNSGATRWWPSRPRAWNRAPSHHTRGSPRTTS